MLDPAMRALIEDLLAPLGPVVVKRMFGGGGVFLEGLMFGLLTGGALYLKADERNRPTFEAEGLEQFTYARKGERATLTSCWRTPDRLLDEPDELVDWARQAFAAALRARKPVYTVRAAKKHRGD
jgi:DNA transformation protein